MFIIFKLYVFKANVQVFKAPILQHSLANKKNE